ncbi:cysteine hydrolase [Bacillus salacetis]|uniref:Cysteine hydrolase n=1 Tax=Bacillus salacetis TaxID=2315464 RepID=A0A3A1QZD2_9BACI|nr:cysteine hydrolase family protein [Bacillus salacetis]RIW34659.1 cysteine hydrolase [Bacillus salacetis]
MGEALVIIDVQKGMFKEGEEVHNGVDLLKKLKILIENARNANTPIFYIQHNAPEGKTLESGKEGWEIHCDITPGPEDIVIQKTTPDSFLNTNLHEELALRNISHLLLTGIQTEVCVDTTCRRAFSLGYKATVISDAHSTWDSKDISAQHIINHHNSVLGWFADVAPSKEIDFHQ